MAFSLSGQFDLTSILYKSVSLSFAAIGRFARANIHLNTLQIATCYGNYLTIPHKYQEKIAKQLKSSRKFKAFENDTLYIGTGFSPVPKELAETSGGIAFAGLASALVTSFPTDYAAKVLYELVKAFWLALPQEMKLTIKIPSVPQFEVLCDEIKAAVFLDDFREQLVALGEDYHKDPKNTKGRNPPLAEELASVLQALF